MTRSVPEPPLVRGVWRATSRLILATYADQTPPDFSALVDDPSDVDLLTELANATNQRLLAQGGRGSVAIGPEELVFDVDFSKIINAAFTHPGQGGRFHSSRRGAWYSAVEIETCIAEVGHHHAVTLNESGLTEGSRDYIEYRCDIAGQPFADLRNGDFGAILDPDSHVAGQNLAADLLDQGAAGVVYPSVRRTSGTCVACFRPALLPSIESARTYRLTWSGSRLISATQLT